MAWCSLDTEEDNSNLVGSLNKEMPGRESVMNSNLYCSCCIEELWMVEG